MARSLRKLALALLAGLVWIAIAESAGWIPAGSLDDWIPMLVIAGLIVLGAGVLLGLLAPVGRWMRRGRCARCGSWTERGQTYCADHLRMTVDEYVDRARDHTYHRPRGRV